MRYAICITDGDYGVPGLLLSRLIALIIVVLAAATALMSLGAGAVGALFPSPYQLLYIAPQSPDALRLLDMRHDLEHTVVENFGGISPVWSPDGAHIAYIVYRRGVFILEVTNGHAWQVASGDHYNLAWSPDGRYLASLGLMEQTDRDVLIIVHDLDTGESYPLFDESLRAVGTPSWSPDGRFVAFVGSEGVVENDIYLFDLDTGDFHRVTEGMGVAWTPVWSPDGERIIFASRGANRSYLFYTVSADGGGLRLLMGGNVPLQSPSWSPDGRLLAYVIEQPYEVSGRENMLPLTRVFMAEINNALTDEALRPQHSSGGLAGHSPAWRPRR
jgi:tricorn protease-like protein